MSKIRVVAHRGASHYTTGNTLTSFRLAAEMGAEMIETDIRQRLDHKIAVYHDFAIPVEGGCEARIDTTPLEDLLSLPLEGGEHMPTFEEVVTLCKDLNLGIYLERFLFFRFNPVINGK